jgi:nicotinamidase-related amidase
VPHRPMSITPQNVALAVIDYQRSQFAAVRSMDAGLLLENIVSTVKLAKLLGVPVVHSTINAGGGAGPTVPELAGLMEDDTPIDRKTMNAWADPAFVAAVRATARGKLILCALWTEVAMSFPALDALREGYDVYTVTDAIAGASADAHRSGLERFIQAGGRPLSRGALARGWARAENRGGPAPDRAHRSPIPGMTEERT